MHTEAAFPLPLAPTATTARSFNDCILLFVATWHADLEWIGA